MAQHSVFTCVHMCVCCFPFVGTFSSVNRVHLAVHTPVSLITSCFMTSITFFGHMEMLKLGRVLSLASWDFGLLIRKETKAESLVLVVFPPLLLTATVSQNGGFGIFQADILCWLGSLKKQSWQTQLMVSSNRVSFPFSLGLSGMDKQLSS